MEVGYLRKQEGQTEMINIEQLKKFCCEDISKIENYKQAIADKTQTWDCHHRWEIFMMWRIPAKDLKESGLYYNQPADRLILLPHSEHVRLHRKGRKHSEETRNKISEAHKNISDETRRKISESLRGHEVSESARRKMSEHRRRLGIKPPSQKGKHWFNNGKVETYAFTCPDGFAKGRLSWKLSEETKRKMAEAHKKHWKNQYGESENENRQ